jgi:hypothetical protein
MTGGTVPGADLARSAALSPRTGSGDPIRPILVCTEGLPPAEREKRRLALRREWAGRLIVLTPELRDPRNLDNFLALSPQFPWTEWFVAHPSWVHPEFRKHRYALALDDGTLLKTYSVDFLMRLKWAVETVRPLMAERGLEVPAFYEELTMNWTGTIHPASTYGDAYVEQTILLSGCEEDRDTYLLFTLLHELAHARPRSERHRPVEDYFGHRTAFRTRFGILLHRFLEMDTGISNLRRLWLRAYAVEDRFAPINPGPEVNFHFEGKRWLLIPHTVEDPPKWWSREDW